MSETEQDIKATWKDRQVVFRGLEAWGCSDCGEKAYDPGTACLMRALTRAVETKDTPAEVMDVAEVADLLRVRCQQVKLLLRQTRP